MWKAVNRRVIFRSSSVPRLLITGIFYHALKWVPWQEHIYRDCCPYSMHVTNTSEPGVWFPHDKSVLDPEYLWRTERIYLPPISWWGRKRNLIKRIRLLCVFYSFNIFRIKRCPCIYMQTRHTQREWKDFLGQRHWKKSYELSVWKWSSTHPNPGFKS